MLTPQHADPADLDNLVIKAPLADNWDGSYQGSLDFTETNEMYADTAVERQNLGGEPLVSPNWRFTRPGRYHFR